MPVPFKEEIYMENKTQCIILGRGNSTRAEHDLFYYAGYYIYDVKFHGMKNVICYVPTDTGGYGYHVGGRTIFPGTMPLHKEPDMDYAIIFNTKDKTVSTGNLPLDFELIGIVKRRAAELGFDCVNEEERLIHKVKHMRDTGDMGVLKPKDFNNMVELLIGLYEEKKGMMR